MPTPDFSSPRLDAATVRARAHGRWDRILAALAPTLEPALARPGRHVPCPIHGGKDGFRVFRDVADTGGGICNTCGAQPDGFALLMWVNQWEFPTSLRAVARWLGLDLETDRPLPPPRSATTGRSATPPTASMTDNRRRYRLQQTWEAALPLWDRRALPARRYLNRRGLVLGLYPETLRLHPALPYYDSAGVELGHWPALLAVVADALGQPVTLHRTYLTSSGAKAPVDSPKKLMAYPSDRVLIGGAIRLTPAGPVLGVAEGIETAPAVHHATALPIWAAVSAALLAQFQPPAEVREVLLWADRDRSGAGQGAAAMLAERLNTAGRAVRLLLPSGPIPAGAKGVDWLDILNAVGGAAIRAATAVQALA